MKSLLITGFDPFAHYIINPSWKAVKRCRISLAIISCIADAAEYFRFRSKNFAGGSRQSKA